MCHPRQEFPLGGTVTLQCVGDDHPRHVGQPCEQLAEACLRRVLVPTALHQDVEHMPLLIDRSPQRVLCPADRQKHLIQMPCILWSGMTTSQRIRIVLPECAAPLPTRFGSHRDTACTQQLFHIAIAEADTAVGPCRVADNLDREAVVLRAVDGWCVHAPSMAHQASARQATQQGDNAVNWETARKARSAVDTRG
jgi:hypothetical protein